MKKVATYVILPLVYLQGLYLTMNTVHKLIVTILLNSLRSDCSVFMYTECNLLQTFWLICRLPVMSMKVLNGS